MSPIPSTLFVLLCLLCLVAPAAAQGTRPAPQEPAKKEEPKKTDESKKSADKDKNDKDKKSDAKKGEAESDKVDFVAQVLPILEKNCVECHATASTDANGRKKRPKGGVTLDNKEGIEKSKKGKLVVAKKPDDSLLVHSITLPADDEDRMPPAKKGDKLADDDIALIKKWVEEGADFGSWTGGETKKDAKGDEKAGDGKEPTGEKEPKDEKDRDGGKDGEGKTRKGGKSLGQDLRPLSAEAMAALRVHFAVEPLDAESALVRVSCYGRERTIDDEALQGLLVARDHVGELVLARTQVSDAGMATVAQLANLTHLDLRSTKVGDDGAAALASLANLTSLNLLGTDVGDHGLRALSVCATLRQVYVWQTPASAEAVVAFRQAIPAARVVFAADLPEPMAETAVGGRARRR